VGALALAASACGGGGGAEPATRLKGLGGSLDEIHRLARREGRLSLVARKGYVEPAWTKPFERRTGCKLTAKAGATSGEMIRSLRGGGYDGVSAPGDAALRLIRHGDVAPVDLALIPNSEQLFAGLRDQPYNTVDGVPYGVPHGRAANLLLWRTDVVKPAPHSWSVLWDKASPYKGRVSVHDSPLSIADAALYLKATQPDLGIDDPYELDDKQFRAALALLARQRAIAGEYWRDEDAQVRSFTRGTSVLGTSWQYQVDLLKGAADPVPVDATLPREGSTGWADTWMVSSKAEHPNCAYLWLDYIISPRANAQATEYFGQAPAVPGACALAKNPRHCDLFHAEDEGYYSRVSFWRTPLEDCGDGRGEACKDWPAWVRAWAKIRR
jgi:putative spermidine/putrescine transport system substrate-binding protein